MTGEADGNQQGIAELLAQELDEGEAHIWYLGHCGWAIKTRTRLLIFDYWEQHDTRGARSLANGRINPAELGDLDVYVFVSHDHGDHYDPTIHQWAGEIPNITYLFGWDAGVDPNIVYFAEDRATRTFGDMEVSTVNHSFDDIPEVAYLVTVDGLVIYHSGDHASTSAIPNPTFTGNIDYFAGKQERVDLAFISTFGRRGGFIVNNGDLYTIEKLKPRAVFPMHHGGGEDLHRRFADEVAGEVGSAGVFAASELGDRFFYSSGRIEMTP
jgi:L-ascorbate metabolism protein UlaG (beta-lactamase superfamily)